MKASLLLLPALAGCWGTMPTKVLVPTPVACLAPGDLPIRPPLVKDTELRAATRGERVFAMRRYQDLAEPYITSLEAIAVRCSQIAVPQSTKPTVR